MNRPNLNRVCKTCSRPFHAPPSRILAGHAQFCSRRCATKMLLWTPEAKARRLQARKSRRTTFNYVPKKCWTHGPIYKEKKRQERIAYCQAHPGIMARENNPNWKGGSVPETKKRLLAKVWRQTSKNLIREKGECSVCGSREKLLVHHTIPWRISHSDSPEHLVVVCRKHHRKLDVEAWDKIYTAAINAYCAMCVKGETKLARKCDNTCPLWEVRPYQT